MNALEDNFFLIAAMQRINGVIIEEISRFGDWEAALPTLGGNLRAAGRSLAQSPCEAL